MITRIQKKFALSRQGAVDLIKGCIACMLQNLSLMLPVGLLYWLRKRFIKSNCNRYRKSYLLLCWLCSGNRSDCANHLVPI